MRTAALIAASLAAAASAQNKSTGPFAGTAEVISVDVLTAFLTGAAAPAEVYVKDYGYESTPPPKWTTSPPDFRGAKLLFDPACGPVPPPMIDVDAFSIGVDWVYGDYTTGIVFIPPDHWQALHFSVTRTTFGAAGSTVATEVSRGDGACGDLFSYVMPGSTGVWAAHVDRVDRALDSTEMKIFSDTDPSLPNIDGYDFFVYEYQLPSSERTAPLPDFPTFYFSVTAATALLCPASWWNGTLPSGATILQSTWTGSSWTCPTPFLTYTQLGLLPMEDIDGLAIDRDRQGARNAMLISTDRPAFPLRDPLLFVDIRNVAAPGPLLPYRVDTTGGTVTVASRLGLVGIDDVDAVCSIDPSDRRVGRWRPPFLGPGSVPGLSITNTISASAFRGWNATLGVPTLHTFMAGYPPGPGGGLAAALLAIPGVPSFVATVSFPRAPTPFGGDPVELTANLSPGLLGIPLEIVWVAVDSAANLDVAPTLRIVL